jgi:hypothetical protein
MSNIWAWFNPTRWAMLGAVVLAIGGGVAWGVHALKQSGRDEVRAEWDAANAQAKAAQEKLNQDAMVEHAAEAGAATVVYKTQIKKVIEYVQKNNGAVVCPADSEFIGLFNDVSAR